MKHARHALGIGSILLSSLALPACGGSDTQVACDPATDPSCADGAIGPDANDFPDGSVILPDGAVELPDGAVVDPDAFLHDAGGGDATDSSFGDATPGDATSDATTDGAATDATGVDSTPADSGPVCKPYGQLCAGGSECCSGVCDSGNHCTSTIGACKANGQPCGAGTDCCSLACVGGSCSAAACISDGKTCTSGASCCSGNCTGGACQALNTACKTAGNDCTANGDCCSSLCKSGKCQLGASYCTQLGDVCSRGVDCCTGICNVASGKTLGTCGANTPGSTNCTGAVDGTVCAGDCGGCCSRLCAPYGPTGVKICQPANGCHVNGDLCRSDYDCCGAPGTTLPGSGNGSCVFMPGETIGVCRNPISCNPEGNVCHYKQDSSYQCTSSSSRNDCCSAPGNSGVCKLDALGIPRCFGGGACSPAGAACAYSGDCCSGLPCVPNPAGSSPPFVCGMTSCQPAGSGCTIDGDCCKGLICNKPTGSASGTCGGYVPPGTDAGVDASTDASADATISDSATADGGVADSTSVDGTAGDSGAPPDTAPPACSLYGQSCSTSADCCNAVACRDGSGALCTGATSGCTCHDVIQ